MSQKIIFFFASLFMSFAGIAQLQEGKKNIDKLCGCFDIYFRYAETFSPDPEYKFHKREELEATELALAIENTDKSIVIQHLLVMGDSTVIKHWREDWVFEQPYLWKYQGDKKWTKQELKPEQYKGKWTQTVWEVDDAPRYQGVSEWINTDGKTFWQSSVDAPLPRREYTTRSDYNILRRGNRLVLTENGWTHEQDNDKVLAKDGSETLIAQEKGYNIYRTASPNECAFAKGWWTSQATFWNKIRTEWNQLLASVNTIHLQTKIDNKMLYQYFDELSTQYAKKEIGLDAVSVKSKELLKKFVQAGADVAQH